MIIGLCGYARSGKDALAELLHDEWGFQRYAFADILKEAALEANPYVSAGRGYVRLADLVNGIGWEGAKTHSLDARLFLQRLGTGMRRTLGEHVWLDEVIHRIAEDGPENAVITDVRFPNEAKWVKDHGHLVRVSRPGVGPVNGHGSETAIDHIEASYDLLNDGDLEDLRWVARLLPHILLGLVPGVAAL